MQKSVFLLLGCLASFISRAQAFIDDSSFFTPATVFHATGLKNTESNKRLRVYTKSEEKADDILRTVDIRWVFASKTEAEDYLGGNLGKESEGGYPVKKMITLPNASKIYVFREESVSTRMYNMMGVEHVHWYYLFVVDRVVAKVFTAGNKTAMATSYRLAWEAAKHISSRLGLPVNETDATRFDTTIEKGFKEKLDKGKLAFHPLPGFEPKAVPAQLARYFDQEYVFPGEKYCVRYFIIANEERIKGSLEDSLVYRDYRKEKVGASQSVSLNIMMPDLSSFQVPRGEEMADRQRCRNTTNSDFIVEYAFPVGAQSQLASGYKYCYMFAMYRQHAPDCYVVFLSDDVKKLELFRQVHMSSLKYTD